MFEYITGELVEKNPHFIVIDVQGVGYKMQAPVTLCTRLPHLGERVRLFVSWVVRELSQTLYGFENGEERDLFERLIALSGIGPRTALAILGHFSPQSLEEAVLLDNVTALTKVPGIGKKTAEKLLVDLKTTVKGKSFSSSSRSPPSKIHDGVQALLHLGYSPLHAEMGIKKALEELSETSDLSLLIATAIKKIAVPRGTRGS